jgi:hypothetical protein
MSLINEALKKVERSRHESSSDGVAASVIGGVHTARHGRPPTANTVLLMGAGALALVVLSVVLTMFLVNRPSTSERIATETPVTPAPAPAINTPVTPVAAAPATPPIVLPNITSSLSAQPATEAAKTTAAPEQPSGPAALSTVAAAPSPPAEQPTPVAVQQPTPITPVAPAPAAAEPVPNLAPDAPDDRVTAFVESVRVTGIRSSGSESRVLMNERVYRVNDIVDRTLNVRLIKASADSLTFRDARGVTYEKRF